MPPPRAGAPPCKGRRVGCDSRGRLRSECSRDYSSSFGRRFESCRLHLGGRSSEVEHTKYVSAPLVAALAAQAQTAGLLTGSEAMEGANPSGGSFAVMVQQQNLGAPPRGSGCDSRSPLRSNAEGTPLAIAKASAGSKPAGGPQGSSVSLRLSSTPLHAANASEDYTTLWRWCLRAPSSSHLLSPHFSCFGAR